LLFNLFIILFSLLLLFNLIKYYLLIIAITLSQRPGILFKPVINVCKMAVYLSLVIVVLLAVLCTKLCAVPGNKYPTSSLINANGSVV
jgi:hypothetical protein